MKNEIILLIGHRGVGKTSLLKRLSLYCSEHSVAADTIDLDEYIEAKENKRITKIFMSDGEKIFRSLEKKYLKQIISTVSKKTYISIGAGFMGPYPDNAKIIFIKRSSDKNGRIFLNRPRLNNKISAIDEYNDLYLKREQHYTSHSDLTLVLQEGLKNNNDYEKLFFGFSRNKITDGVYSLLPHEVKYVPHYLKIGLDKIEVRTDLFSQEQITKLINEMPEDKLLLSIRGNKNINSVKHMDWTLELGQPSQHYHIISSHNKADNIENVISALNLYADKCDHLKLAVPVNSIDDLKTGHAWYLENPKKNCFLPMSYDGRFNWYRLIQKYKLYPNFFKTTEAGTALDQPYFHEWASNQFSNTNSFAAIIGEPVNHSWTPNEHEKFFHKLNMPVVKINLSEGELTKDSLNFLGYLGLKAAAVTSPLKIKMSHIINGENSLPINTLVRVGDAWRTKNTDDSGFKVLANNLADERNIILWGGGGVNPSIKKILPQVSSYSARSGAARVGESVVDDPQVIIWAVGRSRHKNWPNSNLAPAKIVDLNYTEDSPGKEYALMVGAEYISGELMFTEQAKKQQEFWSEYLI